MGDSGEAVIVWDSPGPVPDGTQRVYTWSGYEETSRVKSLMCYAEANADRLRTRYLAWVYDFGMAQVDGRPVIEHLQRSDGFSYWWMTLLAEKSMYKSGEAITDAIRLFALEELLRAHPPTSITFVTCNRRRHEAVRMMTRNLTITYRWRRTSVRSFNTPTLKMLLRRLPHILQGGLALVHFAVSRWQLRHPSAAAQPLGRDEVLMINYFFNIDVPQTQSSGQLRSQYWNGLGGVLDKVGGAVNWLHIYIPHRTIGSTRKAKELLTQLNTTDHCNRHALVEAGLSLRILGQVIVEWISLMRQSARLTGNLKAWVPQGSNFSLWSIMCDDWYSSLRGTAAVHGILRLSLFDKALSGLPHQRVGCYLCENQAWERALIWEWRRRGHGRLLAVIHSTVRFWDLRYFADVRLRAAASASRPPWPEQAVINGPAMARELSIMGEFADIMTHAEALRFGHLRTGPSRESRRPKSERFRLLILGDYLADNTARMMQTLREAASLLPGNMVLTVKPHPNTPIDAAAFPELRLNLTAAPLGELIAEHDVAYASSMTAAAVDAYLRGLRLIVRRDDGGLNMSPLRGVPEACFISTPDELACALREAPMTGSVPRKPEEVFHLEPSLPRWTKLLTP
jgi:surface carbohydrate biosynthesis protein (TIGR04326 family)